MFFTTISAEVLRICRAASYVVQFFKTSKVFLHRMLRQEADPLGVKKVLAQMMNRHALQFEKYNTNNRDLIQKLLKYFWMLFFLNLCMFIYKLYDICADVYVCQF